MSSDSERSWKATFLRAAGFGAGVAVVALAAIGGGAWYAMHPPVVGPWNRDAVTAKYADLYVRFQQKSALDAIAPRTASALLLFTFRYTIENQSGRDHVLPSADSVYRVLVNGKGLERDTSVRWDGGPSVPSGQSVNVGIQVEYECPEGTGELDEKLNEFTKRRLSEMEGFVALDQVNRYEINFPKPPEVK